MKQQNYKTKFIRVKCSKCNSEHVVFEKASSSVKCSCGEELAIPSGGKAKILAKKLETLK